MPISIRRPSGRYTLQRRLLRPESVLAGGFLALILLGSALLCLPAATISGKGLSFFDSLFTATSAVCVTGLVAVDTGTTFSALGQAVLLVLIQVGGLGFMVFTTLVLDLFGKRLSLQNRVLLRESMSGSSMNGLVRLTGVYCLIAFVIEGVGALLLAARLVPLYGPKGVWYSVFHSVSAFCNAGFDLFGGFSSLTSLRSDPVVILTVSALIILGGTGFFVIFDVIANRFHWRALSLQSRLVLLFSGGLTLSGTLLLALCEWNNPATLAFEGSNTGTRLLDAFFQSVTMRTAGFNSIDLAAMTGASKLICIVLMFIGASPASTGGGVKTTTMALVLLAVWSVIRGYTDIHVMKKRLSGDLVRRALAIVTIALMLMLLCTVVLTWAEHDRLDVIDLMFESASAMATVGVSTVGTPNLTFVSRVFLIPIMYLGRVGPLTLALAFANKLDNTENRVRYPEDKLMIG